MEDNILEDSVLLALNPLLLLSGIVFMSIAGILSAYAFSKLHDIKKSIILYIPISVVIATVITILGTPVIISLGIIGVGLVALVYASNHFFYK